jgi:hypothetical protein
MNESRSLGIELDHEGLGFLFSETLTRAAEQWETNPESYEDLDRLATLVHLTNEIEIGSELARVQNHFYRIREDVLPDMTRRTSAPARRWVARFRQLGVELAVTVE